MAAGRPSTPPVPITEAHLSLAVRHGLIGLMAHSSNSEERYAALPIFARLKAHQDMMGRNLRRLLTSLHEHGIPAAVLKGPKLAVDGYAVTDHRTYTDVDLLIPADRVDDALAVLERDEGVPSIPPKTPKADKRNVPVMDPQGIGFNLDLHWDLFSYSQLRGCAKGATEWAWSHAEFNEHHPLGPVWELPDAAVLAFLGTHAVLDHRFRLILFRDLAEMADKRQDWAQLVDFSHRWGLRSTTYVALLLAVQIAEADFHEPLLRDLRPATLPVLAVERLLRRTDLVHFDGHDIHPLNLAMVLLHDDRAKRLRLLLDAPGAFPEWRRRVGLGTPSLSSARRQSRTDSSRDRSGGPLTLHVLPVDIARGAQRYAEALSRTLDGELGDHRTVTIFQSDPIALHADIELGVRPSWPRASGFHPLAALRLWRLFRRLRPDVVVAHGGESLKYSGLVKTGEMSLVYYKIGTSVHDLGSEIRKKLYRRLVNRCDAVVGVSEEMVDEAHAVLGVPRARSHHVPNGRDPEAFLPWRGSEGETTRFVNVGNLNDNKRPRLFVEVIRRLHEAGGAVEGVLVGDGQLLDEINVLAEGLPIEVLGRRDDVPEILATSDVFLFTSVAEGMPGVLIEAAFAGLPIITTDVPGARQIVDDGRTGLIVAMDDLEGLVEAARRLQSDPELRRSMGEAGRAKALDEFTLEASVEEWRSLLRGLVDAPKPVSPL